MALSYVNMDQLTGMLFSYIYTSTTDMHFR